MRKLRLQFYRDISRLPEHRPTKQLQTGIEIWSTIPNRILVSQDVMNAQNKKEYIKVRDKMTKRKPEPEKEAKKGHMQKYKELLTKQEVPKQN